MSKNTVILSVSIPIEDAKFLDDTEISASGIFQDKIREIRRFQELNKSEKARLLENINRFQRLLDDFNLYFETQGLDIAQFYHWRQKKDVLEKEK